MYIPNRNRRSRFWYRARDQRRVARRNDLLGGIALALIGLAILTTVVTWGVRLKVSHGLTETTIERPIPAKYRDI